MGSMEQSVEGSVQDWSPLSAAKWPVVAFLRAPLRRPTHKGWFCVSASIMRSGGTSSLAGRQCLVMTILIGRTHPRQLWGACRSADDVARSPEPSGGACVQRPMSGLVETIRHRTVSVTRATGHTDGTVRAVPTRGLLGCARPERG